MILQLDWRSSHIGQIQGVHRCVIHHWKAEVFSILMIYVELNCDIMYIKILKGNLTVIS